MLAWPVDGAPRANGPALAEFIGDRLQFLAVFNLLGWPAISIPLGRSEDGRAIGVQLVCKRGEDAKLLDVAADLERILGA
jgi:Asp-tRNA(Asn)/Glu-tRNA(Gln) amidotransferase A subunit family amidase